MEHMDKKDLKNKELKNEIEELKLQLKFLNKDGKSKVDQKILSPKKQIPTLKR